jgi:hypothetical protein
MPTGHYIRKPKDLEVELRKRFVVDPQTGCWEWTGYKVTSGYGSVQINNVTWMGTHLSWTVFRGPVPVGKELCHSCDNPGCVNSLEHLFPGTHLENMQDAKKKGRMRPPVWTEDMRRRRGAASRLWWANATAEQKAKIHCTVRDPETNRFVKVG